MCLSRIDHGAVARLGNALVLLAGRQRLLLEAVQDLHGFLELGDLHHPIDAAGIANADFLGTRSDIIEASSCPTRSAADDARPLGGVCGWR